MKKPIVKLNHVSHRNVPSLDTTIPAIEVDGVMFKYAGSSTPAARMSATQAAERLVNAVNTSPPTLVQNENTKRQAVS